MIALFLMTDNLVKRAAPYIAASRRRGALATKLAKAHALLWARLGPVPRRAHVLAWALTTPKGNCGPVLRLEGLREFRAAGRGRALAYVTLGEFPTVIRFRAAFVRSAPLEVIAEVLAHEYQHVIAFVRAGFVELRDDTTFALIVSEADADAGAVRVLGLGKSVLRVWQRERRSKRSRRK